MPVYVSHFLLRCISIIAIRNLAWESELKVRGFQEVVNESGIHMLMWLCLQLIHRNVTPFVTITIKNH